MISVQRKTDFQFSGMMISKNKNIHHNTDRFGVSVWQYSLLRNYALNGLDQRFLNELRLEKVRQKSFPKQVSRLQGLYFFESEEFANLAIDRWNMPEMKKYISKVNVSYSELTRVDSEWITFNLASSNNEKWIYDYWKGETYGIHPLTEILVNGMGIVQNHDLRIEAYKRIYNSFPESTLLLASSICGFAIYNLLELALTRPAILYKDHKLIGEHYIYMKEFDSNEKEIAEAIDICRKRNELPSFIMPEDRDAIFRLPDFSGYNFEIDPFQQSDFI